MFFKNKYFKNTICWIVITALLLQSFPLQAKAGFLEDIFTKLMEKIRLPDELKIEEDGDVMLGSWRLGKCIYRADTDGDGEKECVNPFSVITLGESQVSLIKDGRPNIPRPKIPEICELKIPLPPEEEPLSKEERRALSKACSDFRRIQRAAANTVYFARKIFNNTDPFSECLFLRNCKTSCYLRFGEISYVISWVDVVLFFVPAGWVNTVRKIFNFISKLNEIRKLFDQLKTTINSAITIVNDLFQQASYLKTFYDSLTNLLNVEGGMKGFQDLLYHYSNNLLKFSQAKSESLSWIGDAQRESLVLISELENEEGVEFLFGYDAASRDKREELRIIIDSYRSNFAALQQMVNLLRENGKSLDEEDVPIITYPEGPSSCYVSASTIPRDCSVSLSGEECILYCPEKIYTAHYTYVDAFHTYDIPPFGSMGPMAYERLYYELTARDCVVEHIEGEDIHSNDFYFNFSCPEREYRLSYPQDFGIHTITFEEPAAGFTIQTGESEYTKIPVEVTITCPGDYTVYHYYPTYLYSEPYNWFEAFIKIYDESDVTIELMHSDNVFDLFEELKYLQGVLSEKAGQLPLTEEELYPWENEGEKKYWITETFTVYDAGSLQEAEEIAAGDCQSANRNCNPILVYTDWDSKIRTIEEINFDPIIEARDRVPPTVLLPGGYYYESDLTVTFLTEPFVIFKADLVIATTTEVERKIEEAKPKCQDVHLSDGGWEYCPAGKFVSGVRKNWDSNANYIRCCDLPEEGVATPSCEEVHLSDGGWEHCPAGKFVSGVRKNWDSKANYIQCCDLPEEATSSPVCEEVHLSDGGWEYCSSSKFVSGVRKNWDSHANYIECCDLPEERIPEQSFEDFETVLAGIRELRGKIEDLKNYFVRLNELWPEEGGSEKGYSAKTYVENIIETKEISQDIVTTIGESEVIFNQILSLEDDLLATPGLPAENREIIEQVFAPTGPLKGEINEFLFEGPASIKNFAGVYECPGEGFLSNLKCFEESNGKTFEEIWHFINATEKLEEVILSFSTTTKQVYQIRPTLEIQPLQIDTSADDLFKEGKMEINFGREGVDSFSDFKDKLLQTPLSYLDDLFYGNQIPGIDDYLDDIITLLGGFIETSIDSRLQTRFDNNKAFLTGFLNDEERLLGEFRDDEVNEILNEKCPTIERLIFGDENLKPGCKALNPILRLNLEDIECNCKDKSEICQDPEKRGGLDLLLLFNLAEERTRKCNLRYEIISQCGPKPVQYTPEGETTVEYWEWSNCISWIDPADFGIDTLFPENLKIEVSEEEFKEKCIELDYQKALKEECDSYEILKTALENRCDVWEHEPYRIYCQELRTDISKLIKSYFPAWGGSIPDLTKEENKEQLDEVRGFCATKLNDIRTPLEEVMMVYSVLLGIKSGTLFFRGIRTSTEDAKRVYQDAQKFIAMIKELPAKLKETSEVGEAEVKSGVSIDAIRCIETPATGWGGLTGPRGGPVCPRIDYLFSIVESNFAIMRQNLIHMDMVRRRKEWIDIEVGTFRASLIAKYPVKYHSVDDIYEEAEDIRNRVRDLWAIATAINFANANCTCGQSFCELPLCISGIPLTLSPLKDPYCYLVYILRYPLLKVAENLENFIK